MTITPESLSAALTAKRYETARRIGLSLLAESAPLSRENFLELHEALIALGDFQTAIGLLTESSAKKTLDRFTTSICLAEDFHQLIRNDHYRISPEAREGLTFEEYGAKYKALCAAKLREAERFSDTSEQKAIIKRTKRRFEQKQARQRPSSSAAPMTPPDGFIVRGRILSEDGAPVADATVTLGLAVESDLDNPAPPDVSGLGRMTKIGPLQTRVASTDETGAFAIPSVPGGIHDFLSVTLDPAAYEIPTCFPARKIETASGGETDLGTLSLLKWESAPKEAVCSPHPEFLEGWKKVSEAPLHNPFNYDFPRQLLKLPVPDGKDSLSLRISITPGSDEPFQVVGSEVAFFIALPAYSRAWIAFYTGQRENPLVPDASVCLTKSSPDVWQIDTGEAGFRIAGDGPHCLRPPILQVRGPDGIWRGEGRFCMPENVGILEKSVRIIEQGPLLLRQEIAYRFTNDRSWSVVLTALAGQPCLLVHEKSENWEGASFEFSLKEFSGGRGFLHWLPETGSLHWTTLARENREVGRLSESIPWWIPPQGFAYAMTADNLHEQDYIALFTVRRGDWVDRDFERLAQGPVDENGCENRELDWPYPEMVGSSISWITAQTTECGDAFFRFGFFSGERHWGVLVSSLAQNDGTEKQLAEIQHANSSPRLQDFKDWHFDEADTVTRPHVLFERGDLFRLREKRKHPGFSRIANKIYSGKVPGAIQGFSFALENNPLVAWRRRIEILCDLRMRVRMTLLGRDRSDLYSPVGGRAITQIAEDYDLLAPSGVFSREEDREVRASLILLAHMFMECDLMNWRYNSRNANFEADRVEIVGTIGLVFEGHPDASKFLDHAAGRTRRALEVYCTKGSGKWYENPACYYLRSLQCRMGLIYHLAKRRRLDLNTVPRLKDFLLWGIHLLTPPQPTSYAVMRDGHETAYDTAEKVRKIPPIGDHAVLGRWLPEQYAIIGKLFLAQDHDSAFGQRLIDAYFCSNADGVRLMRNETEDPIDCEENAPGGFHDGANFGNLPLFFSAFDETDIPPAPRLTLSSQRLEGFGAVLRDHFGTPKEVYILIKQGPGGYRYHRTEGSLLLFANGRPLVYDGGEAGETWRHSTLSFFKTHMPLSAGRVERTFFDSDFQFVQGIHPEIIRPGEPVFLSDSCDHRLVSECYDRFKKADPAAVRSCAWVGGSYLIIHDALDIGSDVTSHWHLQIVADTEEGSAANGYRFKGRFGTDLVVLLPGQRFAHESVKTVPALEYTTSPEMSFGMRHLQVSQPGAHSYLGVLMPLRPCDSMPAQSSALFHEEKIIGVTVASEGLDDIVWFSRDGIAWEGDGISFLGKYGALLKRGKATLLVLADTGAVGCGDIRVESTGAKAVLRIEGKKLTLHAEGNGIVHVRSGKQKFQVNVTAKGSWNLDDSPA